MGRRLSFVLWVTRRILLPTCRKHYSETFHWSLAASTIDAACHSDRAKLVNSATEYMGKALVIEGMDR